MFYHRVEGWFMSIISIGYSRRSVDNFIDILKSNNVLFLIDVRSKPYSKYSPDYNQDSFKLYLKGQDIKYVFMGDTVGGLPKESSCYTDGKVDYVKTAKSQNFQEGLSRLIKASSLDVNVAIMCAEMKPEDCHRSKLIGEELKKKNVHVCHIDKDGSLISQDDVINRITKGQYSMFDEGLTSVKKYKE